MSEPRSPDDPGVLRPLAAEVHESLFRSRTVLIFGEITMEVAQSTTASLLALAGRSHDPIRIVLHSPGGHVESADTIHDVIRFIEPEVTIVGTGWVASAGALIFAAARRPNRLALPNTRFLLHQPLGGTRGSVSDIEIEAAQILSIRARLNRLFAAATGRDEQQVARETERDLWMTAAEALDYGLVGRLVERVTEA